MRTHMASPYPGGAKGRKSVTAEQLWEQISEILDGKACVKNTAKC